MRVWWLLSFLAAGLRSFPAWRRPAPGEQDGRPGPPSRFHSFAGRHVRVLAALMLAIAALVAVPGAASARQVMISNINQNASGNTNVDLTAIAQGFTTGGAGGGYTLDSIEVAFARINRENYNLLTVTLHSASGSNPGAKVADLTLPERPSSTAATTLRFTAPDNTQLTANTVYYLVLDCNTSSGIVSCGNAAVTNSNGHDAGAITGWSIADGLRTSLSNADTQWTGSSNAIRIRISRTAPEMYVEFNNVGIEDGDTTPRRADNTDIGEADWQASTGYATGLYLIHNTGRDTLELTGNPRVAVSGTDSGDFTVITQPDATVEPGGVTRAVVRFNPSRRGLHAATLSIANNDPNENPYNFTIKGTGTHRRIELQGNNRRIAHDDTTPTHTDHTDFGSIGVPGSFTTRTFTIFNAGSDSLGLTGNPRVAVSGRHAGDFTVTRQPAGATVSASGLRRFTVRFQPSATGERRATLSIAHNGLDSSTSATTGSRTPYTFAVKGTGTGVPEIDVLGKNMSIPDEDISPSTADGTNFGSLAAAGGMLTRTFTIRNTGLAALSLTRISVSGPHAADFTVTMSPASSVAAGGSTMFKDDHPEIRPVGVRGAAGHGLDR